MISVSGKDIIYFDNNATTRVAPPVFEEMVPYLTEFYGNPSSAYGFGRRVKEAVEDARARVAKILGCDPKQVIFTSCGTESDNAALLSALQITGQRHVVTSTVEHSAIKNQCEHLERLGYAVTHVPVSREGLIDPDEVIKAIRPDTAIVSLMWANNETGVLFPIEEISKKCAEKNILFHTDAVQVVGKIPIRLEDSAIDFLSLSGHKLHAPKGVGVLYARKRAKVLPYVIGGGQEKGKRGGTENVASIVGLGKAAEMAAEHLEKERAGVKKLRDRFEKTVLETIPGTVVNGHLEQRLPNTTNISFDDVEAEALLLALDRRGICASAGSACTTGSIEPSHVLRAMQVEHRRALSSLRFSFSIYNTEAEADIVLPFLRQTVLELRQAAPRKG